MLFPIGFAHRGARDRALDNTLPAFRLALALGAGGLESDAWLSAEGEVVLDHDGLVGPPWRRRPIAALQARDLPAHIPSLAALYQACGTGFALSLDLKDPAAGAPAIAVARAAAEETVARLWLCHPEPAVLAGIRAGDGRVHLVHSSSARSMAQATGLAAPAAALAAVAAADAAAGIDAINLRAEQWDLARVAVVHQAGLRAFAWDAQRPATLARLLAAGVDALYSDHVGRMVAALERHAACQPLPPAPHPFPQPGS